MDKQTAMYSAACTRVVDDEKRILSFVASTEQVARDDNIVLASAWNTDNYEANPVVMWCHDTRSLPIGKAVAVRKITRGKNKRMEIDVEFAGLDQQHELAEQIYLLYRDGFLNAVSVGFIPKKVKDITDEDRKNLDLPLWGYVISEAELTELSCVPVPADTGAVKKGLEDAISVVRGLLDEEQNAEWDRVLDKSETIAIKEDTIKTESDDYIKALAERVAKLEAALEALTPEEDVDDLDRSLKDDLEEDYIVNDIDGDASTQVPSTPEEDIYNLGAKD